MAQDLLRRLVYGHIATGVALVASTAAAFMALRFGVERTLARCVLGVFVFIALLGFFLAAVNAALTLQALGGRLEPADDVEGEIEQGRRAPGGTSEQRRTLESQHLGDPARVDDVGLQLCRQNPETSDCIASSVLSRIRAFVDAQISVNWSASRPSFGMACFYSDDSYSLLSSSQAV